MPLKGSIWSETVEGIRGVLLQGQINLSEGITVSGIA